MLDLLPSLFDELGQVIPAGATPVPNITNYRLYGDHVSGLSHARNHIGAIETIESSVPLADIQGNPLKYALENHSLSTMIKQIEAGAPSTSGFGNDLQFAVSDDIARIAVGTAETVVATGKIVGGVRYDLLVEAALTYFLDPKPAYGYEFGIGDGSLLFGSVDPTYLGENLGYKLFYWEDEGWVFRDDLLPTALLYDFGEGVDRFQLYVYDFDVGRYVFSPYPFAPGITFVGDGQFTGFIALLDRPDAAVPEPGTLSLLIFAVVAAASRCRRNASHRISRLLPAS